MSNAAINELKKLLGEATDDEAKAALKADITRMENEAKAKAESFLANLVDHIKEGSLELFHEVEGFLHISTTPPAAPAAAPAAEPAAAGTTAA